MKTPHKHAALIHAWADGAKIEWRDPKNHYEWEQIQDPSWLSKYDYRVAPDPLTLGEIAKKAFDENCKYCSVECTWDFVAIAVNDAIKSGNYKK